tara:strand:- start:38 stop:640 length:603 start_codon:yes stop_codon:yes gene_type:complete
MKNILKIFIFTTLISCNNSQKATKPFQEQDIIIDSIYVADREIAIDLTKPIRENQSKIDQIKKWSQIDSLDIWESAEGGTSIYLYDKDSLKKIVLKQYGETGKMISEFYIKNGKLSLANEKSYDYNRPIYWDSIKMLENGDNQVFDIKKSELIEYWTYFKDDRLITQINNQEDCPSDIKYLESERIRLITEYNMLLNKKK